MGEALFVCPSGIGVGLKGSAVGQGGFEAPLCRVWNPFGVSFLALLV